jgi:pyrroloquinoline quinone (PQQ) biosynthesis protein C
MAATNYAIEGATGEWSALICSSEAYENTFEPSVRKKAMKWLKLHAQYDDTHPWEALEIICTIMGGNPTARGIRLLQSCILKSYEYMRMTLDHCLLGDQVHSASFPPTMLMEQRERKRA